MKNQTKPDVESIIKGIQGSYGAIAHLIAAAPEMLEALEKIRAYDTSELGNEYNWFRQLQVDAAYAIARARGEA